MAMEIAKLKMPWVYELFAKEKLSIAMKDILSILSFIEPAWWQLYSTVALSLLFLLIIFIWGKQILR